MYGISNIKIRDHNSVLPYISTTQRFLIVAVLFIYSKSSIVMRKKSKRFKSCQFKEFF